MRISPILALSFSLAAVVSACVSTGDGGPDGAPDGGVAERGEALTWASGMEWTGAHKIMSFTPGADFETVVDSSPTAHEVFQVLVDPRANSTGNVNVSRRWDDEDEGNCPAHTLSVRAFAQNAGSSTWYEIRNTNVTSQSFGDGGEFPHYCNAEVNVAVTSSMAQVRVMTQARTKLTAGQYVAYVRDAATVKAGVTSPAPELNVTADIQSNGSLYGVVKNVGPVTADATDTMFVYAYDYCPPPQGNDPFYCEHRNVATGTCNGAICGLNTIAGPRQTIPCTWSKSFNGVEIGANGGTVHWSWGQNGVQNGCGSCSGSRCVNVRASVTSRVTTSPYNLMPSVQDQDEVEGIL